jgi:DNA-binding transcriptional LysR family regulator
MLRFNQYDQVIRAALAGQGIALGRLQLLGPMLADGKLKALTAPRAGPTTSYGYWLIKAKPKPPPDVLATARWIKSQAEIFGAEGLEPSGHESLALHRESQSPRPQRD